MKISATKAYWVLNDFSRKRHNRLHIAGQISGEITSGSAAIVAVNRDAQLLIIEMFGECGSESHNMALRDAAFHLHMLGDPRFEWISQGFHLVAGSSGTSMGRSWSSRSPLRNAEGGSGSVGPAAFVLRLIWSQWRYSKKRRLI
jgi:hypothetical protein